MAEDKPLQPHPSVQRVTLDNGFKIVLMTNDFPRDRMYAYLNVDVGSLHEEDNEQVISRKIMHVRALDDAPVTFCSFSFLPGVALSSWTRVLLLKREGGVEMLWYEQGIAHYLEHLVFLGTEKVQTSPRTTQMKIRTELCREDSV